MTGADRFYFNAQLVDEHENPLIRYLPRSEDEQNHGKFILKIVGLRVYIVRSNL